MDLERVLPLLFDMTELVHGSAAASRPAAMRSIRRRP